VAFFSKVKFGELSFPLFVALVISYIFKDRIKELGRLYFDNILKKYLYDQRVKIKYGSNEIIGICREGFSFVKERLLPKKIKEIRNRDFFSDLENGYMGEKVIVYRKNIRLFSKKIKSVFSDYRIDGVNDIMRFNIMKFTAKMDNPEKKIYIYNNENYRAIYGKRVYHMNLIIRYKKENNTDYKRFRIIFNREGIKKIEEVRLMIK